MIQLLTSVVMFDLELIVGILPSRRPPPPAILELIWNLASPDGPLLQPFWLAPPLVAIVGEEVAEETN